MSKLRVFINSVRLLLSESQLIVRERWVALLLFVGFSLLVTAWMHRWDPLMEEWARTHQGSAWTVAARQLSYWGKLNLAPVIGVILLAIAGFWRELPRLRWAALAGLLGGCTGGIAVNIVKVVVGRPRPFTPLPDGVNWMHFGYDYASFPSGHAAHCVGMAAAVLVLAPRFGLIMILFSFAVGWSRWYLMRHYVTDVWAGACLGCAIGVVYGLAARRILQEHRRAVDAGLNRPISP